MLFSRLLLPICVIAAFAQPPAPPKVEGLPARTAPGDYQAQAKLDKITIAADFVAHAVPTMQGPLTSEDYVAVEVAFFGPADARPKISFEDFSIKINGKKTATPSQQYGMMMKSLSDPEWVPDEPVDPGGKSKTGLSTGGGQAGDPKPSPPKMPFPLRRAMEQKALKSVLPEGERPLPVAGLVFFPYRGKDSGIHNVELIYNGAAGKATLTFTR
jgi:hypothetical protein